MTPIKLEYPVSVAILYYKGEAEDLMDCVITAENLKKSLESRGHMVRMYEVTKKNWRKALHVPGRVVFNLVEDEDWKLYHKVGLALSKMGRAQVGHEITDFKYVSSKTLVKKRMYNLGIATPPFRIFNRRSDITQIRGLEYPLIVKPANQHASVGIDQNSVVIDQQEMEDRVNFLFKNYPGEVIVEEFVEGREFHVTVIGNGNHLAVLPYVEVEFGGEFKDNWSLYSYDAKWNESSWEYWDGSVHISLDVSEKLQKKIDAHLKKAFRAFNCRDIARFDVRVDDKERPYIIDMNQNPGIDFHNNEETWISARSMGWSYADFIETLIGITYKRHYGKLPDRARERQFLLAAGR